MGKSGPRHGSLQFWPRKRAQKSIPRVNWSALKGRKEVGLLGFICYKVGMKSAYIKDLTPDSMTKNKRVVIPATIIEAAPMKIFSIRLYKNKKAVLDILNDNIDKELKKKASLPKTSKGKASLEKAEKETDFDDLSVICYSQVKKIGFKKSPDIAEIGLSGTKEEKLEYVKENLAKEISVKDVFKEGVVDVRGVTTGRGTQGPVKRFGITLRVHKAEKGQRRVGSIGPWHPARVTFRVPFAGQTGFFNRIVYNNKIISVGNIADKDINQKSGFKKYGKVKNDYLILAGSLQGPSKRQILITTPLRPTKKITKKNYEFIGLR